MTDFWEKLKKLNPFHKEAKTEKTTEMSVTAAEIAEPKTPIRFGDQAVRNMQVIQQIQDSIPGFEFQIMSAEMAITASWLTKDENKDAPVAFECNGLAYKQNADDYLRLQTEALHHILSFHQDFGQIDADKNIDTNDFDLNRIEIAPLAEEILMMRYKQQSAADHDVNDQATELKQIAIGNILDAVQQSKGQVQTFTAFYGDNPFFD